MEAEMDEARAELQAERDAEEKYIEENTCEKCGGETGDKLAGDESYKKCSDCGWIDLK